MKLTDRELVLKEILGVYSHRLRQGEFHQPCRHSDGFVCVLTGGADYDFGKVTAGDVFYLAHRSDYRFSVTAENYSYIFADMLFEKEEVAENAIFHCNLEKEFRELYHLWKAGAFTDRLACRGLLYRIYGELAKSELRAYVSAPRRKQMEAMAAQMAADPTQNVAALSAACGMSEVHFCRLFERVYQKSPKRYMMEQQVARAKELLLSENCTVAEVAERCGFRDPYYFSRCFKELVGRTPGAFRKL
ncbi:MAG: helix-turn-helix transcriptional regulator [Clostridia bacterium]|nr:helix-turn-helix transcriptional regulator [Clostridia bacterium]